MKSFLNSETDITGNFRRLYKQGIIFGIIKEKEKKKFLPKHIVAIMKEKGFPKFGIHCHTDYWQKQDGKNSTKNYGVSVEGQWYWYENWLREVENYCENNKELYE